MNERFDAIVIGAGLGGMAAATRLAAAGLNTVILERSGRRGGTAAYYEKDGFCFPAGPLGFGNPHLVEESLSRLGLGGAIDYVPLRFQLHAFGLSVSLAPGPDDLAERLGGLFPGDMKAVRWFFESVRGINLRLERSRHGGGVPGLSHAELSSAGEFLAETVSDARLERLLGAVGTGTPRAGMPFIASLWGMLSLDGLVYPEGGFPALISAMSRSMDATGRCSLRLQSRVSRIAVSGGRVVGVLLDDGGIVEAPAVISNADIKTTYLRLLDQVDVPPDCLEAVRRASLTASGFHVSLGVDSRDVDLSAFDGGSRIIYRRGEAPGDAGPVEIDWSVPEVEPAEYAGQELEIDLLSAEDNRVAPPGCAVVLIRPAANHAHFSRYRPFEGRRTPSYAPYKKRLAHALVKEASGLLPGLAGAVSVIDVATPLTYEEEGGRFEGAIAGWAPEPALLGDGSLNELVRTPVSGLYTAGHQALSWMMLGGVPTALLTGITAADAVRGQV